MFWGSFLRFYLGPLNSNTHPLVEGRISKQSRIVTLLGH